MSADDFHEKPFDEATLTKLEIFQLYTREWLPVFLSREQDWLGEVHLYDFFAGPGSDASGVHGSPLRTLEVLREYSTRGLAGWGKVLIEVHFSDDSEWKAKRLGVALAKDEWNVPGVRVSVAKTNFEEAFANNEPTLQAKNSAKLLLLDQFGVSQVTPEVFRKLTAFPRTDFLFFISSTTLHRFREHPAIKQKIKPTDDFNQVHHAVLEYYRDLLPTGRKFYLAPFSIKKGSNIYGLVFGSAHPLGMDKFLSVAWTKDQLNGNANFDINRDAISLDQGLLNLGPATQPLKLNVFDEDLEARLRRKQLRDENDVMEVCFAHGVRRSHAGPVLQKLKQEGLIDMEFKHPSLDYLKEPRPIRYL